MSNDAKLRFDRFEVDPELGTITEFGTPLHLQPQPFKLLIYLAARPGRLVTRSEIQEHLWGKDTYVDFESSLNFCISQIRSTLADDAENPRFIQTCPKRGYRFISRIERAESNAASDAVKPEEGRGKAFATAWKARPRKSVFAILVAALGILLVAGSTAWRFRVPPTGTSSGPDSAAVTHQVSSARAYDAYLKGLYEWHQWTPEGWKRSCEYFRQATENDPSYAPAYAALANCYRMLVGYNALPAKEGYLKAKEAAQKAVLLDPNSSEAHTALGSNFLNIDWNWPAAHAEFNRALQLNPNNAEAHLEYGVFLRYMGDFDGAIREGKRSEELDPLSNIARLTLCSTYAYANKLEQAVDECNRSIQLQPDSEPAYIFLSQIFARQHKFQDSALVTVKALRLEGSGMLASSFMANYHKLGYMGAEALLAKGMQERYRDPKAYENQLLFMQLDKKESAIKFLEEADTAHDSLLVSIKSDPVFAFLHDDPRFKGLLSRMHFEAY